MVGYTANEAVFTAGQWDIASPLVVANGQSFADALTGGALASAVGGRLVLTPRDALPADVLYRTAATPDGPAEGGLSSFALADNYVVTRDRRTVYIVGGTGSVSPAVARWFTSRPAGYATIVRLAGADRYSTAAAVAEEIVSVTGTTTVRPVVVSGEKFADAIAGSAMASARKQPLVLVRQNSVPASVTAFYASRAATDSIVLGGPSVVSDAVAARLKTTDRIAGIDRYETCARSVAYGLAKGWFKPYHMAVVTGSDFADGCAAGTALGRLAWPTLLTNQNLLPVSSAQVLRDNTVLRASVLGGKLRVGDSVADQVKSLLK